MVHCIFVIPFLSCWSALLNFAALPFVKVRDVPFVQKYMILHTHLMITLLVCYLTRMPASTSIGTRQLGMSMCVYHFFKQHLVLSTCTINSRIREFISMVWCMLNFAFTRYVHCHDSQTHMHACMHAQEGGGTASWHPLMPGALPALQQLLPPKPLTKH